VLDRRRTNITHRLVLDIRIGTTRGQQAQEVRFARPVGPQDADALAEPDLGIEGLHQSGRVLPGPGRQSQTLDHDGSLGRAPTSQTHPHVLPQRNGLRRAGLLELAQAGLRGLQSGGHAVVELGLDTHGDHEFLELDQLLVPPSALLVEPVVAVDPGLLIGREAPRVHPDRVAATGRLQGGDPGRDPVRSSRS
jgi:hypothetical protein